MQHSPLFILALLFLLALPAHAQDDTDDPALPDIAPREVEIRGELEFALPTLERPSIDELAPAPRIPDLPVRQQVAVEPTEPPAAAELPARTLTLPAQEPASQTGNRRSAQALAEGALGRYLSRSLRGRGTLPLSAQETAQARLRYQGTNGHAPFGDTTDARSASDLLEGSVSLETTRWPVTTRLEAGGFFTSYSLYGALADASALAAHPERTGRGGDVALSLRTRGDRRLDGQATLRYQGTSYNTDIFDDNTITDTEQRVENRLALSIDVSAPIRETESYLEGRWATAGIDRIGLVGNDVTLAEGGAGAQWISGPAFDLKAGARLMTYTPGDSTGDGGTYVVPSLEINAYPSSRLHLYLRNRPGLEANTLAALFRHNPYLINEPTLQPSAHTIDAEAGVRLRSGAAQFTLRGGVQYAPDRLFFQRTTTQEGYRRGFMAARYGAARIFQGGGDVVLTLPGRFHTTLGLTVRNGRLTKEDTAIPYFAPVTGHAMVSYALPAQKGFLKLTGTYEAPRPPVAAPVNREAPDDVPAFLDIDVEGTYRLAPQLRLLLRAENISPGALERWERYPRPSLTVSAGLQWRY